jgi:hypothetical protein
MIDTGVAVCGEQPAVAATDVNDLAVAAEVVAGQHRIDGELAARRHRVVERLGQIGVGLDVLEERHANARLTHCAPARTALIARTSASGGIRGGFSDTLAGTNRSFAVALESR